MDLPALLAALSEPAPYPRPGPVEVRQTHISVVFLVGDTAYKIRKPVNLGFVDFSTLEKRKHDCDEEVRLNRRLAPSVYRGVVPITVDNGQLRMAGSGVPVEWAVEMVRLPEEATLKQRLARDEVTREQIESVARRVAEFHRTADRGAHISRYGHFDVVAGNAGENFAQMKTHVGVTVRPPMYDRVRELTEKALADLKQLIESRAVRNLPCDTHGDLHLSHVYLFPDREPPDDLVIIDCIEFAERYRFADPVADIAFLVMDLAYLGRRDLARACADTYFAAMGDNEGRALLDFYVAYRAIVRAKVKGIKASEPEVTEYERLEGRLTATAHWWLALGTLEEPLQRPALVLVGGLPGTGKSTLSRGLAQAANFTFIRADEIRKELAGVPVNEKAEGIYTDWWTHQTYLECGLRANRILEAGGRVLVDATFHSGVHRAVFLDPADFLSIPAVFFVCQADPALVRERLRARRDDASDADEKVYEELAARWTTAMPRRYELQTVEIDTTDAGRALEQALTALRAIGLA